MERFWALGLPTQGSCAGHWAPEFRPQTFVTTSIPDEPSARRRWQRLAAAFLAAPWPYDVVACVTPISFTVEYGEGPAARFQQKQTAVLAIWARVLDTVGVAALATEPAWGPWPGPALDVPRTVDPVRMLDGLAFAHWLHAQNPDTKSLVDRRLSGVAWATLAQELGQPAWVLKARYAALWAEWLAIQEAMMPAAAGAGA
ncbi:MAG: hypothetical protein OWV35_07880 [Firmicutes bacterium]|nr:hypothetical protein [Bacillota bacterium]